MSLAQCAVLTRPLATFMDEVFLVETVRQRLRLRLQGLRLEESKCTSSEEDLVNMNLHILVGDAGWEVVLDGYELLSSDPERDDKWCPEFGLSFATCAPLIIATMCDSWRRLVLPHQNFTASVRCARWSRAFVEGAQQGGFLQFV